MKPSLSQEKNPAGPRIINNLAGCVMPAEWEPHEATWLAWPANAETWPARRLAEVQKIFLQMIEALLDGEKVHLLAGAGEKEIQVRETIRKAGINLKNLVTHPVDAVDAWIRDYGPTFVTPHPRPLPLRGEGRVRGAKVYIKWIFNAWGGKYPELAEDTHLFEPARGLAAFPCFDAGIVLEGGSIEANGAGVLMTTEQCLLNPNRNPKLPRAAIEEKLKNFLGVEKILWLGDGIAGDDTDGHIDDVARFVTPDTILAAVEENERDENHAPLKKNWQRLEAASDARGRKWNLVRLPMPGAAEDAGVRLPASYANFYIGNKVVLLPVFKHANDKTAAGILRDLFPQRVIVPIDSRALVYGLGAIHCVTQQEPAG